MDVAGQLEVLVGASPWGFKSPLRHGPEIVEAPVGVVWKLLTNLSGWGSIFDFRVTSVEPPGPAAKGQRMLGEKGPRWLHLGGSFEYTLIDETHYKLEMDVRL